MYVAKFLAVLLTQLAIAHANQSDSFLFTYATNKPTNSRVVAAREN
jgi:hypothetical protein